MLLVNIKFSSLSYYSSMVALTTNYSIPYHSKVHGIHDAQESQQWHASSNQSRCHASARGARGCEKQVQKHGTHLFTQKETSRKVKEEKSMHASRNQFQWYINETKS